MKTLKSIGLGVLLAAGCGGSAAQPAVSEGARPIGGAVLQRDGEWVARAAVHGSPDALPFAPLRADEARSVLPRGGALQAIGAPRNFAELPSLTEAVYCVDGTPAAALATVAASFVAEGWRTVDGGEPGSRRLDKGPYQALAVADDAELPDCRGAGRRVVSVGLLKRR